MDVIKFLKSIKLLYLIIFIFLNILKVNAQSISELLNLKKFHLQLGMYLDNNKSLEKIQNDNIIYQEIFSPFLFNYKIKNEIIGNSFLVGYSIKDILITSNQNNRIASINFIVITDGAFLTNLKKYIGPFTYSYGLGINNSEVNLFKLYSWEKDDFNILIKNFQLKAQYKYYNIPIGFNLTLLSYYDCDYSDLVR
jgi:hypothetical protein